MPDFYYQIKARQDTANEYSRWIWPPVFSGMVTADDKKQARAAVDVEYGQKFPMRVLAKDIESAAFLLNIFEVSPDDSRTRELFEVKACKKCGGGFRIIDHYNNWMQRYAGRDFCSDACRDEYRKENDARMFTATSMQGKCPPVIYKIENVKTGKVYVGKTTQPFTLRWWQHFFHGTDTVFHKAIKESKITDWNFSILEVVEVPEGVSASDHIFAREQYHIRDQGSMVPDGYNSATAKREEEPLPLMEMIEQELENA